MGGVRRYLRSRQGELEPVCTSRSLSSLSAELRAQGISAREVAPGTAPAPHALCQGPPTSRPAYWTMGSMSAMRSATMRDSL